MSWDGISAIAELVAAIGVVASLAYLAVQIRQNTRHIDFNTRAVRASTFQSFSDTFGKRRYADSFVEFISDQLAGQPVEQRRAATEEELHV
jgi:hypothetical protein